MAAFPKWSTEFHERNTDAMAYEYWLECTVSQGQFGDEYAVSGHAHNGAGFSLFAGRDDVDLGSPVGDDQKPAKLKVDMVTAHGDLCLVRLPHTTLENGRTVTVLRKQIESRPAMQEA